MWRLLFTKRLAAPNPGPAGASSQERGDAEEVTLPPPTAPVSRVGLRRVHAARLTPSCLDHVCGVVVPPRETAVRMVDSTGP